MNPLTVPEDEDDLALCMVDGPNDLGVDFLHREDSLVTIVQTKFHSQRDKQADTDEFLLFCDILARLHSANRRDIKNHSLREKLSEIDWESDRFELHFISLAPDSSRIKEREICGQSPIKDLPDIEDRVTIRFLGQTELNTELRDSILLLDNIEEDVVLRIEPGSSGAPWMKHENIHGRVSYICMLKGTQIFELVKKHRKRLFNLNIRHYLGEVTTNKGIIRTSQEESSEFFFYNNGLSAVAVEVVENESEQTLSCRRLSIINGAQTANSIFKAIGRDPQRRPGDVTVLLRISVIDFNRDTQEGAFLDHVTEYNNTQNAIKLPDFRSNDSVQRSLAKHFDCVHLGGKKFVYRNKREGASKRDRIAIKMEEFTKALHSFRIGPPDYFGGTRYLFDNSPRGGYCKVFGDSRSVWDAVGADEFRLLAGTWFLCAIVMNQFKSCRAEMIRSEEMHLEQGIVDEPVVKQALERKWLVYFTVGELLRKRYEAVETHLDHRIVRLSDPKCMQDDKIIASLETYTRHAMETLVKLYKTARTNTEFSHRNWYREEKYLNSIREEIAYSSTVISRFELI
jgi:hypothetical protein